MFCVKCGNKSENEKCIKCGLEFDSPFLAVCYDKSLELIDSVVFLNKDSITCVDNTQKNRRDNLKVGNDPGCTSDFDTHDKSKTYSISCDLDLYLSIIDYFDDQISYSKAQFDSFIKLLVFDNREMSEKWTRAHIKVNVDDYVNNNEELGKGQ